MPAALRNPKAIPGSEFEVSCDVVPALGQTRLTAQLKVDVQGGSAAVDRPTGRTSNPKYYALAVIASTADARLSTPSPTASAPPGILGRAMEGRPRG